jgi:hypothetical protein
MYPLWREVVDNRFDSFEIEAPLNEGPRPLGAFLPGRSFPR